MRASIKFLAVGAAALVLVAAPMLVLEALGGPSSSWARGVDVSSHQGTIDWNRVRTSGLSFAIVRVSDGTQHPDSQFQRNWAGAKSAGLVRGVYQYFRPTQNAEAQADLLVNAVGTLDPGDLPPVLDLETLDGASSSAVSAAVTKWINRVKARTGLTAMIYVSPGFWNGMTNRPPVAGVPLWVAHWGASSPQVPAAWSGWAFWQTSDHATVQGIATKVDEDYFHGTPADLRAFAASHGAAGLPSSGGTTGSGTASTATHAILHKGDTGSEVTLLQQLLENRGYDTGGVDGIFGVQTATAVAAFQRDKGLVADSVVGPLTWSALTH